MADSRCCVASRAAVSAGCAENVEVALRASQVSVAIFRLNPSALPTTGSLLPLDVGLTFAIFLDLDRALHHTNCVGAMRSAMRIYAAKRGLVTKNADGAYNAPGYPKDRCMAGDLAAELSPAGLVSVIRRRGRWRWPGLASAGFPGQRARCDWHGDPHAEAEL